MLALVSRPTGSAAASASPPIVNLRSVSTSGRSVGGCGRWPEVDTYGSVHLGNKWTLRTE